MIDEKRADASPTIRIDVIGTDRPSEGAALQIDAREVGGPRVKIPTRLMALFRLTGRTVGWESALSLLLLGAAIQKTADLQNAELEQEQAELSPDDINLLTGVFNELRRAAYQLNEHNVLEMTYELLHASKISRGNAAVLASDILGKKINPDAWRKAVDKWARDNHKPPVDLPRGRPSRGKPE